METVTPRWVMLVETLATVVWPAGIADVTGGGEEWAE